MDTHKSLFLGLAMVAAVLCGACTGDNTPAMSESNINGSGAVVPVSGEVPIETPADTLSSPKPGLCERDLSALATPLQLNVAVNSSISAFVGLADENMKLIPVKPDSLPKNAQFDPATGIFSYTPSNDDIGHHTVTFKLVECPDSSFSRIAKIAVLDPVVVKEKPPPVDLPPVIEDPGKKMLAIGEDLSFDLAVTDPENGPVQVVFNAPTWVTVSATDGKVSLSAKPTRLNIGETTVQLVAVDSKYNASTRDVVLSVAGWQSVVAEGLVGNINAFAVYPGDPNVMHAITTSGHYSSGDGGLNWVQHLAGLESASASWASAMATSNKDGRIVFAGLYYNVYETLNGGLIWEAASPYNGSCGVEDVLVHPKDSRTIFLAQTEWDGCCSTHSEIQVSKDEGRSFVSKTGLGTNAPSIRGNSGGLVMADTAGKILVTAVNPTNIAYTTVDCKKPNHGIFISKDSGETWSACNTSVFGPATKYKDLAAIPSRGEIYLGTDDGIYFSKDLCQSWSQVLANTAPELSAMTVTQGDTTYNPSFISLTIDGNTLLMGLGTVEKTIRSFDKYGTYRAELANDGSGAIAGVSPVNLPSYWTSITTLGNGHYMAWGLSGLKKSIDGGKTFATLNANGLVNYSLSGFAKLPGKEGRLFAATTLSEARIVASDDGHTFKPVEMIVDGSEYMPPSIYAVATDDAGRLFALSAKEVFMSEDVGKTFRRILDARENFQEYCPAANSLFYRIAASPDGSLYLSCLRDRVYVSKDVGKTWQLFLNGTDKDTKWKWRPASEFEDQRSNKVNSSGIYDIKVCPSNPKIIYVVYSVNGGIAKSEDGGETFHLIDENGGKSFVPLENDNVLCYKATALQKCIISNGKRSTGGGAYFTFGFDMDPNTPDCSTLYATNYENVKNGACVYKSTDGGESWTCSYAGLKPTVVGGDAKITKVLADTTQTGVVYALTAPIVGVPFENGLFVSIDGGSTFSPLRMESFDAGVVRGNSMYFDPDRSLVYLGTNAGMYISNFPKPQAAP